MIGQVRNINIFKTWKDNNTIPRFILVIGEKNSGRRTLVKELRNILDCYLVECDNKVDSIRQYIENCYKCSGTTIYLFQNVDNMSQEARNALLKVTEEPPKQAHFIFTVNNIANVLPTLQSRSVSIFINPYTDDELDKYFKSEFSTESSLLIRKYSTTPGMMHRFKNSGEIDKLVEFCDKVINNVGNVTGVNAFKIVNSLKLKEDDEGFDADLFFIVTKHLIQEKIFGENADKSKAFMWAKAYNLTCKYYNEFRLSSLKKDSTLDMWILELRSVLRV